MNRGLAQRSMLISRVRGSAGSRAAVPLSETLSAWPPPAQVLSSPLAILASPAGRGVATGGGEYCWCRSGRVPSAQRLDLYSRVSNSTGGHMAGRPLHAFEVAATRHMVRVVPRRGAKRLAGRFVPATSPTLHQAGGLHRRYDGGVPGRPWTASPTCPPLVRTHDRSPCRRGPRSSVTLRRSTGSFWSGGWAQRGQPIYLDDRGARTLSTRRRLAFARRRRIGDPRHRRRKLKRCPPTQSVGIHPAVAPDDRDRSSDRAGCRVEVNP